MGGIIGALVVGLVLVVFLLVNQNGQPGVATNPNPVPNAQSTQNPLLDTTSSEPTVQPAPRMEFAEFMALYNDPARRPVIVDVRNPSAYAAGHIEGAINIPEAEVAARVAEFPKDKLIVAYCQ